MSLSHSGEAPLGYNEEGVRFEDLPKSRVFAEIAVRLGQAFDIGNLAAGRTFADLLTLGPTVHVTHVPIKVYFLATSTINQFFCFCSLLLFLKTSGFPVTIWFVLVVVSVR